jgi:hypothetical protein
MTHRVSDVSAGVTKSGNRSSGFGVMCKNSTLCVPEQSGTEGAVSVAENRLMPRVGNSSHTSVQENTEMASHIDEPPLLHCSGKPPFGICGLQASLHIS